MKIPVDRELLEDCRVKILHPIRPLSRALPAAELVARIDAALSEPQGETPETAALLREYPTSQDPTC